MSYSDSDGGGDPWMPPPDAENFEELLERSSFGTEGARKLRARGRSVREARQWPETGMERSQREMEVTFIPPVFVMGVTVAGDSIPELEAEACTEVQARTGWHGRLEVITRPFTVTRFPPAAKLVTGIVSGEVQALAGTGKSLYADIHVGGWPPPPAPRPGAPLNLHGLDKASFRYPQMRVMRMLAEVLGVKGFMDMNLAQITESCLSAAVKLALVAGTMEPVKAPPHQPPAPKLDDFLPAKHDGMSRDQALFALTHDSATTGLSGDDAGSLLARAMTTGKAVTAAVTITYDAGAEAWNLDWHKP